MKSAGAIFEPQLAMYINTPGFKWQSLKLVGLMTDSSTTQQADQILARMPREEKAAHAKFYLEMTRNKDISDNRIPALI